jgi:APA family basic amino acid/polyamine antiporter
MANKHTNHELERIVGVAGFTSNIVNFTIGAGIFVLPAIVGVALGFYSIFAYLICALMLASIMLCYAEIGSRVTSTGGSYAYVEAAFGDFAGFIVKWLFFFVWGIMGDAAVMNVVADSLAAIFPVFSNPWIRGLLFFILVGFMVLINIRGAKLGIAFIKGLVIIKILPLIGIILFGISKINSANLHLDHLPSISTFCSTVLVLFFAFAGFETALGMSGEIKNPKRTIPIGIFLAAVLVLCIYLLLQTVALGVLGAEMNVVKDAPLAAVAAKIVGSAGGVILLVTAALSSFGSVFGDVLNTPRMLFAGAKDGLFPKFLGKVHARFNTPYLAIITYASLIFIFSVSGGFKQLAVLASAAILFIYLAVILATIKLGGRKQDSSEKTFRMPGVLVVPLIGIVAIVCVLTGLSKKEILSTIIFIAFISFVYIVMKKKKDILLP